MARGQADRRGQLPLTPPRSTPARPSAPRSHGSPSPSATGRRCSTTGSAWPRRSPPRWPRCRRCPTRTSTPTTPAATCASRPAPTTRWSPSTRSATWPASAWAWSSTTGSELGFGRTSATSTAQATPRNLLGFKDGTRNIKAEQTALHGRLRLGRPGDRPAVDARRQLPGRPQDPDVHRELGPRLPPGPGERHRPRQGDRRPADRRRRIHHPGLQPQTAGAGSWSSRRDAHIRLASSEHNGGTRILRRGYSFTDGIDPHTGNAARRPVLHRLHEEPRPVHQAPERLWPPTPSTSTSTTPAAPSSPAPRASAPASTGATAYSPDRSDGRQPGSDPC